MRILVAEDDVVTRRLLEGMVKGLGHEVVTACDGGQALACLESAEPPSLALLDWVMPVLTGPEVCTALREGSTRGTDTYLILVTARWKKADIVAGFRSGANDYVTKPFDPEELAARIDMGIRVSCLERKLRSRTREVEEVRRQLRAAESMLPVCSGCRAPRTDPEYMQDLEAYVADMVDRPASCPTCLTAVAVR